MTMKHSQNLPAQQEAPRVGSTLETPAKWPMTFDGKPILYQSGGTYYTLKGEPIEGLGFIGI